MTSFKELKHFLAGQFHPDWTDDGSPEEIVARYTAGANHDERLVLAGQIRGLLAAKPSEEHLETFCGEEAGSDIFPPGLGKSYAAWLKWLAATLDPSPPAASAKKKSAKGAGKPLQP